MDCNSFAECRELLLIKRCGYDYTLLLQLAGVTKLAYSYWVKRKSYKKIIAKLKAKIKKLKKVSK